MKKLNNKGFTLVELLAVIIILAIVVGITVPSILRTTSSTKEKAFTSAAETCADWISREYDMYLVDKNDTTIDSSLKSLFNSAITTDADGTKKYSAQTLSSTLIESCGLKSSNIDADNSKFKVNSNGRICLLLKATTNGDYNGVGTVSIGTDGSISTATGTMLAVGGSCTGVIF